MSAPLENGNNGRNGKGRFLPGNRAAVGHVDPNTLRLRAWRKVMLEVEPEALRKVLAVLVAEAEAGEPWAVRELLDRTLGKAIQPIDMGDTQIANLVAIKLQFDRPPGEDE